MNRIDQLKVDVNVDRFDSIENDFASKRRLNVNDLLKKRQEEKKVDKKNNIIIVSGIAAVLTVVVIIVSL